MCQQLALALPLCCVACAAGALSSFWFCPCFEQAAASLTRWGPSPAGNHTTTGSTPSGHHTITVTGTMENVAYSVNLKLVVE